MSSPVRAPLVEAFWSIQGEGRFVGVPMGFLRLATCPLRCSYCDTVHSYTAQKTAQIRQEAGELAEPNPVLATRAAAIARLLRPAAEAQPRLSLTGGEPLVFPAFLREVGAELRAEGWSMHLETAAIDERALRECIEQVDHLSADYKLPETIGGADHGDAHLACIRAALDAGRTVDVKLVLVPRTTEASLAAALSRLLPVAQQVQLILQPVTPCHEEPLPLPPERLLRHAAQAQAAGFAVRVLPQTHKMLFVP